MNVAKKKRWLRGGELLESRDITSKKNFFRDSFCRVFVQSLPVTWLFSSYILDYTCIYLHTYAHYNTYITSHHICITLQNVSGTLCSLEDFWGFLFSLFFLATCNALDVPSLILRGVSTVFDIWFLVLRGICDILEHGRWILHFETSTCRLARYLQHFTPKINQNNTNNCGLLVSLAIFCCCGLWLSYVIVRVSCGSCCSCCFCCFCCSCWFVFVAVVVVVVPVAVAVGESEMWTEPKRIAPMPRRSFFRPENRVCPAAN